MALSFRPAAVRRRSYVAQAPHLLLNILVPRRPACTAHARLLNPHGRLVPSGGINVRQSPWTGSCATPDRIPYGSSHVSLTSPVLHRGFTSPALSAAGLQPTHNRLHALEARLLCCGGTEEFESSTAGCSASGIEGRTWQERESVLYCLVYGIHPMPTCPDRGGQGPARDLMEHRLHRQANNRPRLRPDADLTNMFKILEMRNLTKLKKQRGCELLETYRGNARRILDWLHNLD